LATIASPIAKGANIICTLLFDNTKQSYAL
jgi:hypothetical protein